MPLRTSVLVIGAGPFGLALARQLRHTVVDSLTVGTPMGFWTSSMPVGMYLRSAGDWHLDPCEVLTIERFLETLGLTRAAVEPLSLELYLAYARWFRAEAGLTSLDARVDRIRRPRTSASRFHVELDGGELIGADTVVLALGFQHFAHIPADLAARLPEGRFAHTRDVVAFHHLQGRRVLILGGRQGAFEWAALIREAGAASVDVVHRHDSPSFAESDWSWVAAMVERFEHDPGWYRRMTAAEQEGITRRLWAEGRLKLEPWLAPRCAVPGIHVRPRTQVASATSMPDGSVHVAFDTGDAVTVDDIILATGYKPDVARVPLLRDLLDGLAVRNGCPVLDDAFQTSIPGLFATSMLATQDFGPFFSFTGAVRTSARLIARRLQA